jgi:phosphoglycolate phosphatase-like HAD superfamily hydrolase
MRLILEHEGPICDVGEAWFAAHRAAAADAGWSRLDQPTFWRITRTKGFSAEILPGARDAKVAEYQARFSEHLESGEVLDLHEPQEGVKDELSRMAKIGPCCLITMGAGLDGRLAVLQRHQLRRFFDQSLGLDRDPRRRPGQLKAIAQNDRRVIVAAGTDAVIRSAEEAGLFTVGISCGTCSQNRLHAAGARVVYRGLGELLASLESGAADLIRAGLLPAPLG